MTAETAEDTSEGQCVYILKTPRPASLRLAGRSCLRQLVSLEQMSRLMGKPTIGICENKDADQLRGNREADQRLCFRYLDSTIPVLLVSKNSSLWPSSVTVQASLCRTCLETTLLVFPQGGSNKCPFSSVYKTVT